MNRSAILFFGVFLAGLLAYFCVQQHVRSIPSDIQNRTYDALQAENLGSIGVSIDGRDITLSGLVIREKTKQRAINVASQVSGVRSVRDAIMVAEPVLPDPDIVLTPELSLKQINEQCEQDISFFMEDKNISFTSGSSTIEQSNYALLEEIARIAGNCIESRLVVEAYTDNSGSKEGNLLVSKKRAEAIATYLRDTAKLPQTITAKGYGSEKPIASNDTAEGRAKNRRIEFKIETVESSE